ncbi:MAG: GDYXXLXY domain-containing protein [Erythrobacter sp.]
MSRAARLAVLALPLAGLAGLWGWSDHLSRQGTDWEVPIRGYDPRDILRGHYVEFRYDWPGIEEDDFGPPLTGLCLTGRAPAIAHAARAEGAALDACAHPVRANPDGVHGRESLRQGQLYVGQERAGVLEQALRDPEQRAFVRFRLRADGTLTPLDIVLRPEQAAAQ